LTNPQKENGYTPIANEILEQIAQVKLSPTQYRIIFIVWRYTYGFNRKSHDLSLGFLNKATGCEKRQLQRELKKLEEMNIIKQNIKNGKSRAVSFNKHYDKWVVKTTIGETTIGEIDNGETDNATIGETDKGAIGEIDNQERHILNTTLKKDIVEIPFAEIIEYLNTKANCKYKHTTKATQKHVKARWDEEFTLEDFKKVIDNKTAEWLNTEMAKYLRPETLFGTKFESYLNQKGGTVSGTDRQQANGESESHNPGGKAPRWAATEENL
jgi:phage replication O-like protein O